MSKDLLIPFTLSLPKAYRDLLRKMAAENNLARPDGIITTAGLARQILCEYLDGTIQDVPEDNPLLTNISDTSSGA